MNHQSVNDEDLSSMFQHYLARQINYFFFFFFNNFINECHIKEHHHNPDRDKSSFEDE